jgi:hypothetical protein
LVLANTAEHGAFQGEVIVDRNLNLADGSYHVLFSNIAAPAAPGPLRTAPQGSVSIRELDGSMTTGPARVSPVTIQPLEVQILRR